MERADEYYKNVILWTRHSAHIANSGNNVLISDFKVNHIIE